MTSRRNGTALTEIRISYILAIYCVRYMFFNVICSTMTITCQYIHCSMIMTARCLQCNDYAVNNGPVRIRETRTGFSMDPSEPSVQGGPKNLTH